ncbi:hypothetical protein V6N13_057124 [Hibiscus sabdariffa]
MLRSSPPANLNLKSAGYSNIAASRSKAGSLALFSSLASILYNGWRNRKSTLSVQGGRPKVKQVVKRGPLASSLTYSFCYLFLGHFKLATAIELQFKQLNRR